tara:strand:- start:172 stop:420 length:249 start_codon:yes stop_codon:yes gene_type:complete
MIDSTISMGSIITILTVTGTLFFTSGNYTEKIESLQNEQEKTVVRVKKAETDITDLKVSVAKIETQLDDRFDRLEEILMDLE